MKFLFKDNPFTKIYRSGFSLVEALAAVVILTIIGSSSLVVINRAMESTADSILKKQAFEVARENMEILLASDSVSEKTESGYSEKYPDIEWTNTIETFYEPVKSKAWMQAVCSAQYLDSSGETQSVEFKHWLTNLTDQQLEQILAGRNLMEKLLEGENSDDYEVNESDMAELEEFLKQFQIQ